MHTVIWHHIKYFVFTPIAISGKICYNSIEMQHMARQKKEVAVMIDLNHLEEYTENNRIEAKKALGGLPHSIWETYSAFANTLGGVILLGVEEYRDKTFHTVDLPDPEAMIKAFWAAINTPNKVSVNLLTSRHVRIETVNGNRIIVIEVPRAHRCDQPVFVDGNPTSGAYKRNGEGDHRCTAEELQAMRRDADVYTQDMIALENMDDSVFCPDSIQRYRKQLAHINPNHTWNALNSTDFLMQLGATCIGTDEKTHPTAAGLLMFGYEQEILREYPDYSLAYCEESDDAQQPKHFTSSSGDWSGNVFDFFSHVSEQLMHSLNAQPDTASTAVHKGIQEALVNCLVNADYYGSTGVEIINQPNEIIMSNPGDFRIEVDEAHAGGMSDPRNSILMKMFSLINVSECTGSGIPDILYIWKQRGWSKPIIRQAIEPNRIILSLPLTNNPAQSTEPESCSATSIKLPASKGLVIAYLTEHTSASCEQLAELLDLNLQQVETILQGMITEGIIAVKGDPSCNTYKLKA